MSETPEYDEDKVHEIAVSSVDGMGPGIKTAMVRDYVIGACLTRGMMDVAYAWATSRFVERFRPRICIEARMAAWIIENEMRHVEADIEWCDEEFRHRAFEDCENTEPSLDTMRLVNANIREVGQNEELSE